jgi:hypothetical protein
MDSLNKYGDKCDLKMQMYWFVTIDVLGSVARIRPGSDHHQDEDNPQVEQVGGFHLFLVWCLCFEMIYLW